MTVTECFEQVMNEEVPERKGAWHEWATLKAYLHNQPRVEAVETYKELFGAEPKELETAPRWLIALACSWKGAELGHKRVKRLFSGIDKQTLAALAKLDITLLKRGEPIHGHLRHGDGDVVG